MFVGYEIYDKEKEYTTPDGEIYTPEMFIKNYSAAISETMAVYVYENTITDAHTMSYLRGKYNITNDVNNEMAIAIINNNVQIEKTESTPIERIAASLEYLVLLFMKEKE
jgi:hypothetical protein